MIARSRWLRAVRLQRMTLRLFAPHRRVLFPSFISAISNGFRRAGTNREPEGLPYQGNRYRTDRSGDFTSPAFKRPGGHTRRKKRDRRATHASATHRPPPQGRLRDPPRAGLKPAKTHAEQALVATDRAVLSVGLSKQDKLTVSETNPSPPAKT